MAGMMLEARRGHVARKSTFIVRRLALLLLEVVLNVSKVDLLVSKFICDAQVLHVLSAQQAQIVQVLWHLHDGFTNLAEAESHLQVVVPALISTRQLTLAQQQALGRV